MSSNPLEDILKGLEELRARAVAELPKADSSDALEKLRVDWLGKKGALTEILKGLGKLSAEDRPKAGQKGNEVRDEITRGLDERIGAMKGAQSAKRLEADRVDPSLPGYRPRGVVPHPVRLVEQELVDILARYGFTVEMGPEAEHEFYNFDSMNIPAGHPARAMQDTFYVAGDAPIVLRTHTSPIQARTMLRQKPPIRIVAPGRVYRADYDATHSPMFHQIEGLLVDTDATMGDLKGILSAMVHDFFGIELKVRLRPSFFPFTEPSAEMDIECGSCRGHGCKTCKQTGWIEIGGAGMVDPEVFKALGLDPETNRGFAFGMGLERMAMLKYGVDDLRSFFEGDHRFISQFARWRP